MRTISTACAPRQLVSGRYVLGPVIGRGGMAEIRDARDVRDGGQVAIKRLRPELAHDAELRRRFEIECAVVDRLPEHPRVVRVLDQGSFLDVPYLVMERLPGPTLRDRLDRGPVGDEEARQLATQLLEALVAVHRAGVLHLDVKPRNVFRTAEGGWKLGDFGAAVDRSARPTQRTGPLIGTPSYVAPELPGGARPTPAADLYGVGVVLYEALEGSRPQPGELSGSALPRRGDDALRTLVARCLEVDPARRLGTAAAALATLQAPIGATQPIERSDDTRVIAPAFLPGRSVARRTSRHNGVWLATTVLLAALGVGSFAVALTEGGSPRSRHAAHVAATPHPPPRTALPSTTVPPPSTTAPLAGWHHRHHGDGGHGNGRHGGQQGDQGGSG